MSGGLTRWSAELKPGMTGIPFVIACGSGLGEFDRTARQQVQHERASTRDRRTMGAPGSVHQPAGAVAVELRARRERHDQIDFAVGMPMVRAGKFYIPMPRRRVDLNEFIHDPEALSLPGDAPADARALAG